MKVRLNGWQRLWVLFSVLHLILVGGATYLFWPTFDKTRHRNEFIERMPAGSRKHVSGAYASEYEAVQELDKMSAKAPKKFVLDGELVGFPNGAILLIAGNKTEQLYVSVEYHIVINQEVKAQRWATVRYALLAWLGPCVVLYALGWAIGWVYRGFRTSRGSSGA